MPDVIFFDNACSLWKFATNPKRQDRTDISRKLKGLHYMLDIWHARNHRACLANASAARVLDPRHEANRTTAASIDTEA
eukprot:194385-Karenia_brevis.AAC.1